MNITASESLAFSIEDRFCCRPFLVEHKRRLSGIGRDPDFKQRIGRAGSNAREATHTALLNHHHRALRMASTRRVRLKRKKCLKWTMEDAEIAPRAIVFDDGDHRLTHDSSNRWSALMLCLRNGGAGLHGSVKFLGAPHSRRTRRRP